MRIALRGGRVTRIRAPAGTPELDFEIRDYDDADEARSETRHDEAGEPYTPRTAPTEQGPPTA